MSPLRARMSRRRTMAAIFVVALAARLALVATFDVGKRGFGFADASYLEYAQNFAAGRGFFMAGVYGDAGPEHMLAFRPPLFPLAWGLVYNLTGGAYRPIWCALALLSATGCVLVYRIGLRMFAGEAPAALGAFGCALYPPLVFHGVNLMTEPFFIFFQTLFVLFLLRAVDRGRVRDAALAGVWLGLGILSRSVLLGFAPLAALWLLWSSRFSETALRRRAVPVVALAGATCLVLAPWWVRNALAFGAFVPTTTDGGHGFYVAHHPRAMAEGTDFFMPTDWRAELDLSPEGRLGEVEMQRVLYRRALSYLRAHPREWAARVAGRVVRLWRPWPHRTDIISRAQVIVYGASFVPLVPFILYGLLAAHRAGMASSQRARMRSGATAADEPTRLAKYLLIDLLVLYTTAVHALFLAMLRYRVPLMPFLMLFAAYGAVRLVSRRFRGVPVASGLGPKDSCSESDPFDALAPRYDETIPPHVRDHYLERRTRMLARIFGAASRQHARTSRDAAPEAVILDVGCGTGLLARRLSAEGLRVVGTDRSAGMLRVAASRGCAAVRADGGALPFADASIGGTYCVALLHHIADAERVERLVAEMARVTKPGGTVVVVDHNPANPYWPVIMARSPQDTGAERLLPEREVVAAFRRAGLTHIRVWKRGFVPDFTPRALMPLARALERLVESLPFVRGLCAHNIAIGRRPAQAPSAGRPVGDG